MRTPNSGRPKSEITGIQCTVAIRLTPALRKAKEDLKNSVPMPKNVRLRLAQLRGRA